MHYLDLLKLASPEAVVVVTALAALAVGLARKRTVGACTAVAAAGLAFAIAAVLLLPDEASLFHGMLVISPLTSLFKIICLILAFFTVILARGDSIPRHHGEYLALLLLATIGLMLLVGSEELLMIFIGLELTGLSLYVMAAFDKTNSNSAEAGLKYFLFGSTASAFTLFRVELDLWHVWNHGTRSHWRKTDFDDNPAFALCRDCHDAYRFRVQDCGCAFPSLGAGYLSRRACSFRCVYRVRARRLHPSLCLGKSCLWVSSRREAALAGMR
jgi:hypothetical protein